MPTVHLPYREAGYFSSLICDYIDRSPELDQFYGRFPSTEALGQQLEEKASHLRAEDRIRLVRQLERQYSGIDCSEATLENIKSLESDNCFTITTGHQLNLFTGPLYFLYKIVSVINLCREMKEVRPGNKFVPVFWMASEDHDFEEINYFNLHGKKFAWDHSHGGAVGELDTDGIEQIAPLLRAELGQRAFSRELVELFEQAYNSHSNLADATRFLANSLFGEQGLVVIDGNDKELKKAFVPYVKKELFDNITFSEVGRSSEELESLGYHRQVNPREINLFYLSPQQRDRIVRYDEGFGLVDTGLKWSEEQLLVELEAHPERFSPNALLRPVYQEAILPNLCYVGGGGEIAYWLQLRSCFEAFDLPFPVLLLRNSVLLSEQKQWNKFMKFGLPVSDLFSNWHELSSEYVKLHGGIPIDMSPQREILKKQFMDLHELATRTDPTFKGAVAAQEKKQLNGLDKLEKRLLKAQKRKMSDDLERLQQTKLTLFPQNSLQERGTNFSEFYADRGPDLIVILLGSLDPLDLRFTVLVLD